MLDTRTACRPSLSGSIPLSLGVCTGCLVQIVVIQIVVPSEDERIWAAVGENNEDAGSGGYRAGHGGATAGGTAERHGNSEELLTHGNSGVAPSL